MLLLQHTDTYNLDSQLVILIAQILNSYTHDKSSTYNKLSNLLRPVDSDTQYSFLYLSDSNSVILYDKSGIRIIYENGKSEYLDFLGELPDFGEFSFAENMVKVLQSMLDTLKKAFGDEFSFDPQSHTDNIYEIFELLDPNAREYLLSKHTRMSVANYLFLMYLNSLTLHYGIEIGFEYFKMLNEQENQTYCRSFFYLGDTCSVSLPHDNPYALELNRIIVHTHPNQPSSMYNGRIPISNIPSRADIKVAKSMNVPFIIVFPDGTLFVFMIPESYDTSNFGNYEKLTLEGEASRFINTFHHLIINPGNLSSKWNMQKC